jgi:hypothetical protein
VFEATADDTREPILLLGVSAHCLTDSEEL